MDYIIMQQSATQPVSAATPEFRCLYLLDFILNEVLEVVLEVNQGASEFLLHLLRVTE